MTCRDCDDELIAMKAALVYACFKCSKLFMHTRHGRRIPIKRQSLGKWKIGTNPQLTKNQLWEQELESMYSDWLARRMLDE